MRKFGLTSGYYYPEVIKHMDYDCAIVGAGPVGLHCATYLGRFLRHSIIFDGGRPRASWIPVTRNFPCFPGGVTGSALLACLRDQALLYGAEIRAERVRSIDGSDGDFHVRTSDGELTAGKIILATGVFDIPPEIPDADRYKGLTIRHCPVCDAYESRGRKIVMFGHGNHAASETLWMAHYSRDLILLTCGHSADEIEPLLREQLRDAGIPIIEARVVDIVETGDELGTVILDDGDRIAGVFRGYSTMGLSPNNDLAKQMGIELDSDGYIKVDPKQQTSVRGVYAAGDIVSGDVAQVVVGMGHAAIACTDINNALLA